MRPTAGFASPSLTPAMTVTDLTGPALAPEIFDITLGVRCGARALVLGAIHAGKSVLLRHIVGLERAQRGRIVVGGLEFDAADPAEDALRSVRSRLGVVFEGSALVRRISVTENVLLPLLEHSMLSPGEARDSAIALLREVGLNVPEGTMPLDLGRGEQRRVALARAIALRPDVLLLDEPTTGLDAHTAHELDQTLDALQARHGFGLMIFSREVRYAFSMEAEIHVMDGGRIVAQGTRDALLSNDEPTVRRLMHRRSA